MHLLQHLQRTGEGCSHYDTANQFREADSEPPEAEEQQHGEAYSQETLTHVDTSKRDGQSSTYCAAFCGRLTLAALGMQQQLHL
jgi:hypothetical protein